MHTSFVDGRLPGSAEVLHTVLLICQIFVTGTIKKFCILAYLKEVRVAFLVAAFLAEVLYNPENKCKSQRSYDDDPCDNVDIHNRSVIFTGAKVSP
jgi:hypothetical protein